MPGGFIKFSNACITFNGITVDNTAFDTIEFDTYDALVK